MTVEEWRPVVGYEGEYEVSNLGRVKSLKRERDRILRPGRGAGGHLHVVLPPRGARRVNAKVHRLVAEAFIPNPEGLPYVLHWDDDPSNNAVENPRWGDASSNGLDAVRNGRNAGANKTHCKWGHEYTPDNTYIIPSSGARVCRRCTWLRFVPDVEASFAQPRH